MSPASHTPAGSLRTRAVRGTAAAFASQSLKFLLNFGVAIILARLVSPEDFGLFGIAFAVTGLLEFAKTGGMVVPVIQSESLTTDQLNALFWFNSALGLVVTLLAFAVAPLVGYFYSDPRLVPVIWVLALVFFSGGVSTQHYALLRRQMRFTALALCEVTALAVASCVAIVTAMRGAEYWSLVYFQLALAVVQAVLVTLASGWVPAWPKQWAAIGSLIRFGGIMMAFDIIAYFNFKVDNLIVAWFLGPTALGFYDKAYQLLMLPVTQISTPISGVVHSTLSRLQREPDRYRTYLSRALLLSTALALPFTTFLFGNAHILIGQLFGPQWLPSVPIFRALAPAAFLMIVTTCVGWIFLSLGRAARQLRWAMFATTVTVAAFFVGVQWGVLGVAFALSASRAALFLPTLMYTCANTPVAWTDILRIASRPAFASLVALGSSVAMNAMLPVNAWSLPRNATVFAATYLACWLIMPEGRVLLRENLLFTRWLYRNP